MHPLHDHIAAQIAGKLNTHRVVVWYDPRREYTPFIDELRNGPSVGAAAVPIKLGAISAQLVEYHGSMFELRAVAEPVFASDRPDPIVVYLPGVESEPLTSALLELELTGHRIAGKGFELKKLARTVLLRKYTEGNVDNLTQRPGIGWAELAAAAADDNAAGAPSVLKTLYRDVRNGDDLVAAWLAEVGGTERDEAIAARGGQDELLKLLASRVGFPGDGLANAPLARVRAHALRYVLAGEFRADLKGPLPGALASTPVPKNGFVAKVRACAERLRQDHRDAYAAIADRVEAELGLRQARIPPADLGAVDTFRFEERALLAWCDELVAGGRFEEALAVIGDREHCYWLERDVPRKALWEAARRMAELGQAATAVRAEVEAMSGPASAWVAAYTRRDGWCRLDLAQRRLEAWVAQLTEDCAESSLGVVRSAYEETCRVMTEGFVRALGKAGWSVPDLLAQTSIYDQLVATQPRPVAYFLVDAMRYEMGVELLARLPESSSVTLRPAMGTLPSITPIGMAALMPGASSSFRVAAKGDKLGATIDEAFLPDVAARKKHLAAKVPDVKDLLLDQVLSLSAAKLAERIGTGQVIVVRSQEIDHAGEAGFTATARRTMDTVIDNLARALRRLAAVGVEHAVIAADHGHLYFGSERDPSWRIEAPGGAQIELHRRVWIGRGGANPTGAIRVPTSTIDHSAPEPDDLDLVFPSGAGVFKAGGDLMFHHGGPSLQELIIPVVIVRTPQPGPTPTGKGSKRPITAEVPEKITARALSATLELSGSLALFAHPTTVRPVLTSSGRVVGAAGMVVDGAVVNGCVTLAPGKKVVVGFLLTDTTVKSLRLVVQDPTTDAELYQSPEIPVELGM